MNDWRKGLCWKSKLTKAIWSELILIKQCIQKSLVTMH